MGDERNHPMKKLTIGVTIGAASCVLVAGLTAIPALASATTPSDSPTPTSTGHPRTLAEIQAASVKATSKRTSSLNAAIAKVNADTSLASGDKSTILGTLNGDLTAMSTVAAKVAADTTATQAAADYKTIFTDYRVYGVALPQARITASADRATSVQIPRLTAAESKLSALLAGKDASKSPPALQADLSDATAEIQKANTALSGLPATALAVTPAEFNANHDVMKPIRATLASARADLKQAREDLKKVVAAVRIK